MASKVRVYGKAQKWTALGIVDAYTKMYPHATLEDINKAFPRKAFSDKHLEEPLWDTIENIKAKAEATETTFDDEHVESVLEKNIYITLSNGDKITFYNIMWTKNNFPKIVEYAKLYDIEIAEFVPAEKGWGKRGGYRLEYLNGYVPPVPVVVKKGIPAWIWGVIAGIVLLLLLLFFLFGNKKEVVEEEKVVEVEKVVIVRDTLFIQQIAEIEKNFNAAEFAQGKADLTESAKFVLHDLAKVINGNENVKLEIQGHTSSEGDPAYNQKLSEERAKAAVDFLVIERGVDPSRVSYKGLGSSQPKNEADPMAAENRRTEFVVIE
jgi:outer membrane protein OmpA-like peptidoglycan-associated protein